MKKMTKLMMVLIAVCAAGSAMAQVRGRLILNDGRKVDGALRWNQRMKTYAVKQGGGSSVELNITPDRVREIIVPRPVELDAAIDKIRKGQPSSAIPALKDVARTYLMLTWDSVATRYLAEAHLKSGDIDKAVDVCEAVIRINEEASYLGEMAPVYWEALLKKNRSAKVEDLLLKAIKSGDRRSSAFAHIRRGDIILMGSDNQESNRKALRDGFLRVITLYRNIHDAQPEALYKAAKSFDKIGQSTRADQMRTLLKQNFPASDWARK